MMITQELDPSTPLVSNLDSDPAISLDYGKISGGVGINSPRHLRSLPAGRQAHFHSSVSDGLIDPYGNVTIKNGSGNTIPTSAIGNRYMFTGREFDEETGLQYSRERTYSFYLGRFLQRDPLGYYDSMNSFEYAFNSPINYIDPYGFSKRI